MEIEIEMERERGRGVKFTVIYYPLEESGSY